MKIHNTRNKSTKTKRTLKKQNFLLFTLFGCQYFHLTSASVQQGATLPALHYLLIVFKLLKVFDEPKRKGKIESIQIDGRHETMRSGTARRKTEGKKEPKIVSENTSTKTSSCSFKKKTVQIEKFTSKKVYDTRNRLPFDEKLTLLFEFY